MPDPVPCHWRRPGPILLASDNRHTLSSTFVPVTVTARHPAECSISSELHETILSYARQVRRYDQKYGNGDFAPFRKALLRARPWGCPQSLLDAGCGPGRDCQAFEREVPVIGVDLCESMLRLAACRTSGTTLVQCDVRSLPIKDESIGAIWSMASLVHLSHAQAEIALAEFHRVLAFRCPLFISVTAGHGTEWRMDEDGGKRWFQHHTESEFVGKVRSAGFTILRSQTAAGVTAGTWINVLASKENA